jgi:hypothetical protein
VALPFAAARDGDEGGEIRWIRVRPSHPAVPSPKIAAMERRKAMRFRNSIASHAMPGVKQYQGAPCGAPCPSLFEEQT